MLTALSGQVLNAKNSTVWYKNRLHKQQVVTLQVEEFCTCLVEV